MMGLLDHVESPHKLELCDLWNAVKSLPLLRYVKSTFREFLDHSVSAPRLKAVFAAPSSASEAKRSRLTRSSPRSIHATSSVVWSPKSWCRRNSTIAFSGSIRPFRL